MKKIILAIIFLISVAGPAISLTYAEKPVLHFDNRNWEVGYEAANEQQSIAEYVLKGETVHSWTELFSLQTFFGLQQITTPKKFMEEMKNNMKPSLQWNMLRKEENDVLYEWKVTNDPEVEDQHEIARIISGKEAIYSIRYTTKKIPVSRKVRKEWIDLLNMVKLDMDSPGYIKDNSLEGDSGVDHAKKGFEYYMKGDLDHALSEYNKAIEIDPALIRVYLERGNIYVTKGDYDSAISDFTQAAKLSPNDAITYYNLANTYAAKKDYDNAITNYTRAIDIDPNYIEAYDNRGISYADKGDYDSAIKDYNKAININVKNAISYINRSYAYYRKGDYEEAWNDVYAMEALGYKPHPEFIEELKKASGRTK